MGQVAEGSGLMVIAVVERATRYGGVAHCQAVVAACDGGVDLGMVDCGG
jgi:hypothetical protein